MTPFKILFLISNVACAPYFPWVPSLYGAQYTYYYPNLYPGTHQLLPTWSLNNNQYFQKSTSSASQINANNNQCFGCGIDVEGKVAEAKNENYSNDNRVRVDDGSKGPTSLAALAYVKSVVTEGLCGKAAEAYIKAILDGRSKAEASGEATRAYITAFNSGERYEQDGACEAAEKAWRQARNQRGKDKTLEATLAFIKKWPGVEKGNPCALAGTNYVKEILAGNSQTDATASAMRSYIRAFKKLAGTGASLNDDACHRASRAFFDAVPTKSDPVIGAGFAAFSDKLFTGKGAVYDQVCLDAMEAFIDSHAAGEDLLTSNLKAARSFFKAFVSNPGSVPADSPCASATLAFAEATKSGPSGAANAAMIVYINEAIKQKDNSFDPVCGAATVAYWDNFIEKKDESAASEAAAVAYLDALESNPDFDESSACGKAAKAYMAESEKN